MSPIIFYSNWDLEQNKAIVSVAEPWPNEIEVDEEAIISCPQVTRKLEGRIRIDVTNGWAEYQLKEASARGPLIGYYHLVESSYEPSKTVAA